MKKNATHKKKKVRSPRIPIEGVLKLRQGGVHSSKKGGKGYDRARGKIMIRKEETGNA